MSGKTVAIIGAGPGGLVAAKTLLHSYPKSTFKVTVYEKSDHIGGIWSVKSERQSGIIPPNMSTNLSQFAVSFSDLAWSSLDLSGSKIHMYPKAWQVGRYLEEYRRRYLPNDCLKLDTEVRAIQADHNGGWTIRYAKTGSDEEEEQPFDFCIVASGFYAKARPIRCKLDGFSENVSPVKIVHSSLYRGLDDILPYGSNSGKKMLVVGGANSGGEVAAALAFDLSNKQYAPDGIDLQYEIIHVLPKPIYGLPHFLPSADNPGTFVPLDVRLYDLSKRPDQPVSLKIGRHTDESKKMVHGLLQGILGTDEFENGFQRPMGEHPKELIVPKAAIQDNWTSYVRSGSIRVQLGRISALHSHGPNQPISASIQSNTSPKETITLHDIAGVIYATGYTPESALSILSERIRQSLSYDPNYPRLPILLPEDSLASHPSVPGLGFVGLYEGPYWGILEMQARQLAARWASPQTLDANGEVHQHDLSERTKARLDSLLDIRSALKEAPDLVPQYIFSDYLAVMEESARDLALTRNDGPWTANHGPVTPSRYLDSGSNKHEADATISKLQQVIHASSTDGQFVPHVVFRGLQGRWKIHRSLKSKRPEYPTGTLEGEAWFHPRLPTTAPSSSEVADDEKKKKNTGIFDQEYLYLETGTLTTDSGLVMPVYKNYAWRFSEEPEKISVWFVKQDGRRVDYLYHELELDVDRGPSVDQDGKVNWMANGDHLCEKDMYVTRYSFVLNGVALQQFEVVHQVRGPYKDYVSKTMYTR